MNTMRRIPWTEPQSPSVPAALADHVLALSKGDPWGQLVAICHERSDETRPERSDYDRRRDRFVDGPLQGCSFEELSESTGSAPLPLLLAGESRRIVCDDPLKIARALAPDLFTDVDHDRVRRIRASVIDAVYRLGEETDQAEYERAHRELAKSVRKLDEELERQRFLGGTDDFTIADVLLYTFSVRLDPVYYELYKATVGRLSDFPGLEGHARDLFERPAFYATTDFDLLKDDHYLVEPVLNEREIVPRGGLPDLDAPHFRAEKFGELRTDEAVEEDQEKGRAEGEWVRPPSRERDSIRPDGEGEYPAEVGRYHLYAPYNCPWSHRALLGRAIKGLEDVVDASIVYFRRDPEHGWQFNPRIPGCTDDRAGGRRYVKELYEEVGSSERSVPVLWDMETHTIVSNESADILRMFNDAFGSLAEREIDLYPVSFRDTIDRLNTAIYQRINNGAYKAGFAKSQLAYDRAFARYFRALDWLEGLLGDRPWLAGSEQPTEADVRLFPTLFRHDAVYYARFKLNERRISDYARLSDWLDRMLSVPGVAEASNLDHARNGYFGRTGNEIVPAGPVPLGLSQKNFSRDVWLNRES